MSGRNGRTKRSNLWLAVAGIGVIVGVSVPARGAAAEPVPVSTTEGSDWLSAVNGYRAMSGLSPVVEDPSLSEGDRDHSCYMLLNGMTHDEASGRPGYTATGDEAGNSGNVALAADVTTRDRSFVDLWMSGPFHAIGVLRPNLRSVGYGRCESAESEYTAAATLDVIRGLDPVGQRPAPIVFPGDGAAVTLTQFIVETPDPLTFCGWTGTAGLPIVALMPRAFDATATATLDGPSGPLEVCVLSQHNTTGDARTLLKDDHVLVAIPREPLQAGAYQVAMSTSTGDVSWTFSVVTGEAAPTVQPAEAAPTVQPAVAAPSTPASVGAVSDRLIERVRAVGRALVGF